MKKVTSEFCMTQFKPAIGALAVLIVVVLVWSTWNLRQHQNRVHHLNLSLSAAVKPPAPNILVNDKMAHPYWGNCNQCHITTNAPAAPITKVFAGPPISIKQPMIHDYWGNCVLCHQVTDGFQPPGANAANGQAAPLKPVAAAAPAIPPIAANAPNPHADMGPCKNCHTILGGNTPAGGATPAAFNRISATTLGLRVQAVNAAQMHKLGLINEDGILILAVAPGSIAYQAGIKKGDELIRINKIRLETMADFQTALNQAKPGHSLKVNFYRGKKGRNTFFAIPENLPLNLNVAAVTAPMTQNQIETQAEILGVPKTLEAVQQAQQQAQQQTQQQTPQQVQPVAMPMPGIVAVAANGPNLNSPVHHQFGSAPYFILYDQAQNAYQSIGNPNFNDGNGRALQTAQFLADKGVKNVIVGNVSTDGFTALKNLHMNVYTGATGTASTILNVYNQGQLVPKVFMQQQQVHTPRAAIQSPTAAAPIQQAFF
nr:magnetochrome domain-containing protein [Desulfobulbaceae bacterium]